MSRRLRASPFAVQLVQQVRNASFDCGGYTQDDDLSKLQRKSRRLANRLLRYIATLELAAER